MSSIFKGMLTALLVTDSSIAFQIRWARLLATAYNLDLLILSGEKNQDGRVVEFDLDYPPDPDAEESLLKIWNLIETSEQLLPGPRKTNHIANEDVNESDENNTLSRIMVAIEQTRKGAADKNTYPTL